MGSGRIFDAPNACIKNFDWIHQVDAPNHAVHTIHSPEYRLMDSEITERLNNVDPSGVNVPFGNHPDNFWA